MNSIGAPRMNAIGYSVTDDGRFALREPALGWYLVRITKQLSKQDLDQLKGRGINFSTSSMIQRGWYKLFLTKEQTQFALSLNSFSLIPFKKVYTPDFSKLRQLTSFLVQAVPGWNPQPPATSRNYMTNEMFIVENASAEQLYADPYVVNVSDVPKISPC
ncbi:hypothetical protein GPJ56_009167 [Histomonas meleagridis]|uniref:uncharacterized protein n=1 Tax=Histomonas meleagridis TaxID=135588 RepID=UPI003559A240|nr:hypothetical protein GPJ56_009167 [Histomonas meleagridis]KAH0799079.1 hypothetical protein GO595_007876 [Histomonas meleagridis]